MNRALIAVVAVSVVAAAQAAETGLVRVDPKVCRALAIHRPSPDVAFKPGVDVRGRPVAPADLAEGPPLVEGPFLVEIEVDLFRRLGVPPQGALNFDGRAILGAVVADADGRLWLNGKSLTPELERQVVASCPTG